MLDALLYAVRDGIRNVNNGIVNKALPYDHRNCEIMEDGRPKPNSGDIFVAVHQGAIRSDTDNFLNEYYSFSVTVTMRLTNVPLDRIGTEMLARQTARDRGFNHRCEQLRAFLHMNWGILQDANTKLVDFSKDLSPLFFLPGANSGSTMENSVVYGFCEPARFRSMEIPTVVTGDWFTADPDANVLGVKSELQFQDCRRLQPLTTFI